MVGFGVAACAVCCIGPIVALSTGLLAALAGSLFVSVAVGFGIAIVAVVVSMYLRGRSRPTPATEVSIPLPTARRPRSG